MVTEDTAADFLWLSDLRAHRHRLMHAPEGLILDQPQCHRLCEQCSLGCAMANVMIANLERALGVGEETVH